MTKASLAQITQIRDIAADTAALLRREDRWPTKPQFRQRLMGRSQIRCTGFSGDQIRITYLDEEAWLGEDGKLYQEYAIGHFEIWQPSSHLTPVCASKIATRLSWLRIY